MYNSSNKFIVGELKMNSINQKFKSVDHIFRGTYYDIGMGIGSTFQKWIVPSVKETILNPPPISSEDCKSKLSIGMELTKNILPNIWEELRGMASGAGVPISDLFLSLYEDLWDSEDFETGCTDIAATGIATKNGRLIMGHNNDVSKNCPPPIIYRIEAENSSHATAISLGGFGISVGFNSEGVVLMGNQLSALDGKAGIPRVILVRAALTASTLEEAADILLHPMRATSYNNVLGDKNGRLISFEGSGKKFRAITPSTEGVFAHTNHYIHPEMKDVDGKCEMHSTKLRLERSEFLMKNFSQKHSIESMKKVLCDHVGHPVSVCRHEDDSFTIFSVICEPEDKILWFCNKSPCEGEFLPYDYK